MLKVILVDDDIDFLHELSESLTRSGFEVETAENHIQLYQALETVQIDLVLLDIGLPEKDGFSILQGLQSWRDRIGVVMLTARGDTGDRVRGLISGADSYLVKPIDIAELSATLHAVARRLPHRITSTCAQNNRWSLLKDGWVLQSPDGVSKSLTGQERTFLKALLISNSSQKVVSRKSLMRSLGRDPNIYDDHFLDTLVSRLRTKIGKSFPLQTVRGKGYTFSEKVFIDQ
ncbi:response regulator transcription factor [Gilvimarinus chinensis]|uniref:response regulator transcription factor n=1 Tax=Gilvimarinus chinensis TaxID=396005 RepID=UPI00037A6C4E|nr:response regulator transcription factor [Gilvimarinus chinensis]